MRMGTVFVAVAVASVILVTASAVSRTQDPTALGAEARQFLGRLGYQTVSVECVDVDSDGDGYVSCTARVSDQNGKQELIPLECRGRFSWGSSCRLQTPGSFSRRSY